MSKADYDIDAKISKVERIVLEKLRLIMINRYGILTVRVDGANVVECIPSLPADKNELKQLQL